VSDDPLPLRILELRAQIGELSSAIRQLQLSGLDDAAPLDLKEAGGARGSDTPDQPMLARRLTLWPMTVRNGTTTTPSTRRG
jgi:hypothetical protein